MLEAVRILSDEQARAWRKGWRALQRARAAGYPLAEGATDAIQATHIPARSSTMFLQGFVDAYMGRPLTAVIGRRAVKLQKSTGRGRLRLCEPVNHGKRGNSKTRN